MVFTFTGFFRAVAIILPKDCFSVAEAFFSAQSADSCS